MISNINYGLSENLFKKIYAKIPKNFTDSSHEFSHSLRVAKNSMQIAAKEGGDKAILIAASLLHDIENLPKNHPRAHLSSQISEQTGICFKQNLRFTQNIWSLSSRL